MAETNNLYPVIDVPEFTEGIEEYDTEYKPSLSWDLEKGDFVRTPNKAVPRSTGLDAYRIWCIKAVATERFSCEAYSEDIGSEMESLTGMDHNSVELALERTIEETLMVNPRTEAVKDFEFSWEPGAVRVKFTVVGIDEESFDIETSVEIE